MQEHICRTCSTPLSRGNRGGLCRRCHLARVRPLYDSQSGKVAVKKRTEKYRRLRELAKRYGDIDA